MRLLFLVSFAMMFLLIEVQGVHLKLGFLSVGDQVINAEIENRLTEVEASDASVEGVECNNGHCSGSRKLLTDTSSTSSTIPTTKIVKNEWTKSSSEQPNRSKPEHREVSQEPYPDIIDIAGMDYSTAKRKSPIHN